MPHPTHLLQHWCGSWLVTVTLERLDGCLSIPGPMYTLEVMPAPKGFNDGQFFLY